MADTGTGKPGQRKKNPFLKVQEGIKSAIPPGLKQWLRTSLGLSPWDSAPIRIDKAQAQRVAVLAPHPDDDVIGCGGTLYKHHLAGDKVTVIYLTDGARGDDSRGPRSEALSKKRRQEARETGELLGINHQVFLEFPDGELTATDKSVNRVYEALCQARAQAVFIPFFLDNHPDHRAANRIFARAIDLWKGPLAVYAYEVWSPLPPNRLVEISSAVKVKEQAIRCHASQMRHFDYVETTLGLNRFRSSAAASGKGYYEAFFTIAAREYAGLVQEALDV